MASYTATTSGNWNSPATWGLASGYPVDGDTVSIPTGITVTVTADAACGTSGATGTDELSIVGTLIVDTLQLLTVSGDTQLYNGTLRLNEGAEFIVDGTYEIEYRGACTLDINGTESNRCFFGAVTGNYAWIDYYAGGTIAVDADYCDFIRLGNSTVGAMVLLTGSSVLSATFTHCYFDYCGQITWNSGLTANADAVLLFENSDWRNPQATYVFRYSCTSTFTAGTRKIVDCTIVGTSSSNRIQLSGTQDGNPFLIENVISEDILWEIYAKATVDIVTRLYAYTGSSSDFGFGGTIDAELKDSVIYKPVSANCISNSGTGGKRTVRDSFIFMSAATGNPAGISVGATDFDVLRNVTVGGRAVQVSSTAASDSDVLVSRHTHVYRAGWTNLDLLYYTQNHLGDITLRSSLLVGSGDTQRFAYVGSGAPADVLDYADYNGYTGIATPRYSANITMTGLSLGDPGFGGSDLSVDPLLSNGNASLATWDLSLGGAGTVDNAFSEMLKLNGRDRTGTETTFDSDYSKSALLSYLGSSFTPTNAAVDGAGYGGEDLGALDFGTVTTSTSSTSTSTTSSTTTVTTSTSSTTTGTTTTSTTSTSTSTTSTTSTSTTTPPAHAPARFTAVSSGSWQSPSTWDVGPSLGYPIAGDTVVIGAGFTVIVNENAAVGTSGAAGTDELIISGTLQVTEDRTLSVRGDVRLNAATLRLEAGAVFEFTGGNYDLEYAGACTLDVNGTALKRASLRAASGYYARVYYGGALTTSVFSIDAQFCDFTRIGNLTQYAFHFINNNFNVGIVFTNCKFDYCGMLRYSALYNPHPDSTWQFVNCDFRHPASRYVIQYNPTATFSAGTRRIYGCTFVGDYQVWDGTTEVPNAIFLSTTQDGQPFLIEETILEDVNLAVYGKASIDVVTRWINCLTNNGSSMINMAGTRAIRVHDSLWWSQNWNPHFCLGQTATGPLLVEDNIGFDASGVNEGDQIAAVSSGGNIARRNITVGATGFTVSTSTAGEILLENHTHISGRIGDSRTIIQFENLAHAGIMTMRSCLMDSELTPSYLAYSTGISPVPNDLLDYTDYNGYWYARDPRYQNIPMTGKVIGDPGFGEHDISINPQLVDRTATIASWDSSLGGAGTVDNAFAEMLKRNGHARDGSSATFNASYSKANVLTYLRYCFSPTNVNCAGAGYAGADLGARPVLTGGVTTTSTSTTTSTTTSTSTSTTVTGSTTTSSTSTSTTTTPPGTGYLYTHINLGFCNFGPMDETKKAWLARRCKIFYGSGLAGNRTGELRAQDMTAAYAANPEFKAHIYFATGFYKGRPATNEWTDVRSWMAAVSRTDREDLFFHYAIDRQIATDSYANNGGLLTGGRNNRIVSPGSPIGFIPGFGAGSSVDIRRSRVLHFRFGNHRASGRAITRIERLSGVVTATLYVAYEAHGYAVGDLIYITDMSTDTTFNGGPFTITAVTSGTVQFAQAGYPNSLVTTTEGWCHIGISSASRAGNIVTITTGKAHGFEVDDSVEIHGVTDASFDGTFEITEVPTTRSFRYSQSGSDGSSSGGYLRQDYWDDYVKCVASGNVWADYLIYRMTQGYSEFNWEALRDQGGNRWDGIFMDSMLNMHVYRANYMWETVKECIDDGGSGDGPAWIRQHLGEWYTDICTRITSTYLAAYGKTCLRGCNGDHLNFITDPGAMDFYSRGYIDNAMVENGFRPGINDANALLPHWRSLWTIMNDYGVKLVNVYTTYVTISGSDWHGAAISWTRYSATQNIWYTDAFSDSKSAITYYSCSGGSVIYSEGDQSPEDLSSGYCYFNKATGRFYAYFPSTVADPNLGGDPVIQGYERSRLFCLAEHYVLFHCPNGHYSCHDFRADIVWDQQANTERTWFEAIGYDIGQPATGGLRIDGTLGTDIWGESCSTSDKGFEMWVEDLVIGGDSTKSRIFGRKFDRGYALFRLRPYWSGYLPGSRQQTFTMPFTFRQLKTDGTLGDPTTEVSLAYGEGAILITDWTGTTTSTTTGTTSSTSTTTSTSTTITPPPETWTTTSGTTTTPPPDATTTTSTSTTSTSTTTTSSTTITMPPSSEHTGPGIIIKIRDVDQGIPMKFPAGTFRSKKWEVYDLRGQEIVVETADYEIAESRSGAVIASGSCAVRNDDRDEAGRVIRTIRMPIDLTEEWAAVGLYRITLYVELESGESEIFKLGLQVIALR